MNTTTAGAIALLSLIGAPFAQAQTADLTRATCAQLMELPRNERGQLIVWLHGYYAGAAQRAMLDRGRLETAVETVQQLCERSPEAPLIGSEARSLFLGAPQPVAGVPGGQAAPAR